MRAKAWLWIHYWISQQIDRAVNWWLHRDDVDRWDDWHR